MAVDDVARALMAMDDEEVCTRVREEGPGAIGDYDFSDEEQRLITEAASDPEVAGHALATGRIGSLSAIAAYEYVGVNNRYLSSGVRMDFRNYLQSRWGSSGAFAAMRI